MIRNDIIIALLSFSATGVAIAQTTSAPPPPPAADRTITRDEFLAEAGRRFDAMDSNHDGKLTPEERRNGRDFATRGPGGPSAPGGFGAPRGPEAGEGPGDRLAQLDTNGDGKISRAEFDAQFDRLDTNHDGVIDATEAKAAPPGPGTRRLARLAERDGKISRAAFDAPFDRLDANHDGVLDAAELQAARAQGGRGGRRFGGKGPRAGDAQLQPQ